MLSNETETDSHILFSCNLRTFSDQAANFIPARRATETPPSFRVSLSALSHVVDLIVFVLSNWSRRHFGPQKVDNASRKIEN